VRGTLALVGGAEWHPPAAPLDAWLLERSGSSVVTVLPTAAKDHPDMAVATAARYFRSLGGEVRAAPVLTRAGVQAPNASWGTLISDGLNYIQTTPTFSLVPGAMLVLAVLSINVVGDGIRDALDPRALVRVRT